MDQLGLAGRCLVMQSTQHAAGRTRMVILNEYVGDAGLGVTPIAIGLHEESSTVAMHIRLDNQNAREFGFDNAHVTSPVSF